MPKISLRSFEKEIEDLIDQNHLQEAIFDCKYLLSIFPLNISTYRLLGKALLESKHYYETGEIFKKVLSVYPDDFVSNVGMSIVNENDNHIDEAIWSMEKAFDCQPSNITIQEELKRLFALRDGSRPTKIRLTRGALVRMYARGELYQQAIAEIKSALLEDPNRTDMEILLAKMYFLSGEQTESVEISRKIIQYLPYSFDINYILYSLLSSSDSKENIQIYKDRLIAIDPYFEFVGPQYPDVNSVPENNVIVDKLSETNNSDNLSDLSWVAQLITNWGETPTTTSNVSMPIPTPVDVAPENVPLQDFQIGDIPPYELAESKEPATNESEDLMRPQPPELPEEKTEFIPDWMQSSGWEQTTEERATQIEKENAVSSELENEEDSADSTIPDWLKSFAADSNEAASAHTLPDSEPENIESENIPSPSNEQISSGNEEQNWMNELSAESENSKTANDTDLPDWLKNFEVEETQSPVSNDDLPDWLSSLPQSSNDLDNKPVYEEKENVLSAEREAQIEQPSNEKQSEPPSDETQNEGLVENTASMQPGGGWASLEELASEASNNGEEVKPEKEIPSWIRSVLETKESTVPEETSAIQPPAAESKESKETSTFIPQENPVLEEETVENGAAISEKTGDDLLEWLRDLKPPEDEEVQAPSTDEIETSEVAEETDDYDFQAQLDRLNEMVEPNRPDEGIHPENLNILNKTNEPETTENTFEPTNNIEQIEEVSEPVVQTSTEVNETKNILEPDLTERISGESSELSISEIEQMIITNADLATRKLEELSNKFPNEYLYWQLLGDAYSKNNSFAEALECYDKAENILISK